MNCSDVQELAELYVLGAVEPQTSAAIEAHLETCDLCQATVDALAGSVEALGVGLPPITPPPALRERILASAKEAAPDPGTPLPNVRRTESPAAGSEPERPRRFMDLWPRLAAAAAVLLLALSGWLSVQNAELRREIRAAREEIARMESYEQALAIMQDAVQEGGALVSVEGTDVAPSARGTLYAPPHGQQAVLAVSGLPPQPGAAGYQLWLIKGDRRLNGGYFEPEPDGRCLMKIEAPMPLEQFDAFGITNEQRGGSPEPHGTRYMWGRNQPPQAT